MHIQKFSISILLILVLGYSINGITQNTEIRTDPEWVIDFKSFGFIPNDIISDKSGNLYSTGSYNLEININDSLYLNNPKGKNDGIANTYFLMKHDSSGKLLWISYGLGKSRSRGVEIDSDGNIYTVGYVFSPKLEIISSGSDTVALQKPNNLSASGIFICKYDSLGNVLATQFFSNNENEAPQSFKIDINDNLIIGGNSFYKVDNESKRKYLLLKFDSNLNLIWQKNGKNEGRSHIMAITTDPKGNIYATGGFFGSIVLDQNILKPKDQNQIAFITKISTHGKVKWFNPSFNQKKSIYYYGVGQAITCDKKGRIFLTGAIHSTLFICRFNTQGKLRWLVQTQKGAGINAREILLGRKGIYVVGKGMRGTFKSTGTRSISFQSKGATDFFIAKYNFKGELETLNTGGGSLTDYADAAVLNNQSIYMLGHILGGRTQFKDIQISNRNYTMWISKFQLDY
jgi:hypothetical protein